MAWEIAPIPHFTWTDTQTPLWRLMTIVQGEKGNTMGKPRLIGMNKPFTPNSKADQKRNKPFVGVHKKGKAKK